MATMKQVEQRRILKAAAAKVAAAKSWGKDLRREIERTSNLLAAANERIRIGSQRNMAIQGDKVFNAAKRWRDLQVDHTDRRNTRTNKEITTMVTYLNGVAAGLRQVHTTPSQKMKKIALRRIKLVRGRLDLLQRMTRGTRSKSVKGSPYASVLRNIMGQLRAALKLGKRRDYKGARKRIHNARMNGHNLMGKLRSSRAPSERKVFDSLAAATTAMLNASVMWIIEEPRQASPIYGAQELQKAIDAIEQAHNVSRRSNRSS